MRQDQDASSDMLLCAKTVWPLNGGESLDFNDWRVGFIGHRPNGRFVEKFCDSDERIMTSERVRMKKLTWPDAPADQEFSRHVHFIRVELFDDGIFKGNLGFRTLLTARIGIWFWGK